MRLSSAARIFLGGGFLLLVGGCSGRPVLYPNEHLRRVGSAAGDQDIDDCMRRAEQSGSAISANAERLGEVDTSATVATTGPVAAISGFLTKGELSSAQKAFVNKCLRDKGYDPVAWD